MKKYALLIVALMFIPTLANSATLRTQWDFPNDETIDGFRIYRILGENSAEVASDNIDPNVRTNDFEYDETQGCGTFYMVAFLGNVESPASNTALWCPDTVIPPMQVRPGQSVNFTIEVVE